MVRRIKRFVRDIIHYARRHPMKVFFMVILPLITGGVLQKILSLVGIRLPKSLGGGSHGGAYGESGRGPGGTGAGFQESLNGLVSLAKMFA